MNYMMKILYLNHKSFVTLYKCLYCHMNASLLNKTINLSGVQNLVPFFQFKKKKSIWKYMIQIANFLDCSGYYWIHSKAHAPPIRANLFWLTWTLTNHSNRMFVRGGISSSFIAGWSAAALGDTSKVRLGRSKLQIINKKTPFHYVKKLNSASTKHEDRLQPYSSLFLICWMSLENLAKRESFVNISDTQVVRATVHEYNVSRGISARTELFLYWRVKRKSFPGKFLWNPGEEATWATACAPGSRRRFSSLCCWSRWCLGWYMVGCFLTRWTNSWRGQKRWLWNTSSTRSLFPLSFKVKTHVVAMTSRRNKHSINFETLASFWPASSETLFTLSDRPVVSLFVVV